MSNYFVASATIVGPEEDVLKVHDITVWAQSQCPDEQFDIAEVPLAKPGLKAVQYSAGRDRMYPGIRHIFKGDSQVKGKPYTLKNLIVHLEYGQEGIERGLLLSQSLRAEGEDTAAVLQAFQYQCLRQFAIDITPFEQVWPQPRTYAEALKEVSRARRILSDMDQDSGLYGRLRGRKPITELTNAELALEWSFDAPSTRFTLKLTDPQANPNG